METAHAAPVRDGARPLADRVAVVTGASGEVGQAIARALAARGAHLVAAYGRRAQPVQDLVEEARAGGVEASAVQLDVVREESLHHFVREVRARFGRVDILVSGAAAGRMRPPLEMDMRGWRYSFGVTADALLVLSQLVAPLMKRQGWGRIIALSSVGVQRAVPRYVAVGASKAAVETMVRYLACELAPFGVAVNCVAASGVGNRVFELTSPTSDLRDGMLRTTPAGRLVTPDDVAGVVAFLCDDAAAMIQGQTILVDGGYSLTP